jgi:hypothetical protein
MIFVGLALVGHQIIHVFYYIELTFRHGNN